MGKLIDAEKLEPDTEWSGYYNDFVSYSQSQIKDAEEVKAIPLNLIKRAREEIKKNAYPIVHGVNNHDVGMTLNGILQVLDELIEGVNDESKEGK